MRAAGLELGARRAVFVRARASGGQVALTDAAIIPLGEGADGPAAADSADADDAGRAAELAFALRDLGIRPGPVRLAAPGRDAIIRYINLPPVPRWRLKLLLDDEVDEVAEKAGEPLAADWRLLDVPDDLRRAAADEQSVLIALAKEPPLEARLAALKAAGLEAASVAPTAVALFDAWVGLGHVDPGTTAVVYAGDEATELCLTRDGALLFARSLPALAATGAARAGELARAISGSVQFARAQVKLDGLELDAVELAGAPGDDAPLLAELGKALKCAARRFDPLERLDVDALSEEARAAIEGSGGELCIALGLALAGSHPRIVDLDLMPRAIRARREFARRTVWMYAAAALLTVGILGSVGRAAIDKGAAAERTRQLQAIERGLEERLAEVEAVEADNRRLARTLSGLAERTLAGDASLWLVGALRKATPERVTVTELRLDVGGAKGGAGGAGGAGGVGAAPATGAGASAAGAGAGGEAAGELAFQVEGEVDNARGDAAERLARFERALRAGDRVTLAKVTGTPSERPGGVLGFALTVRVRVPQAREQP